MTYIRKLLTMTLFAFGGFIQANQGLQSSDIFLDIQYRDYKSISRWFRTQPDFNIVNQHGQTVLIKAVQSGNKSLVLRLLRKHLDVNFVDDFGKTALDYAVEYGHKKIVLELVKRKAMVTNQENMVTVKQIITSRYRLLKAIGSILFGIGTFGVALAVNALLTCSLLTMLILMVLIENTSGVMLSIPFHIASISWKDRMSWYNPLLITTNNVVVR